MAFEVGIQAAAATWQTATHALDSIKFDASPAELAKAMLEAQMKVNNATNVEQKISSAIDKAHQAHSQVASK